MRLFHRLCTGVFLLAAIAGCDSSSNDNSGLIGRWSLIEVNGQPIASGVVLIYTFTAETLTITSDLDCVEVIDYTWASDGSGYFGSSRPGEFHPWPTRPKIPNIKTSMRN